jgi:hypothetical protein
MAEKVVVYGPGDYYGEQIVMGLGPSCSPGRGGLHAGARNAALHGAVLPFSEQLFSRRYEKVFDDGFGELQPSFPVLADARIFS